MIKNSSLLNKVRTRFVEAVVYRRELGAAMVAAIGVMIICIALGALVISQTIATQRDSGRNRARTIEIHAAEASVDTLYAQLQQGNFVCNWETTAGDRLGPDEVGVEAKITYWNKEGTRFPEDHCPAGGTLNYSSNNVPARAQILTTAENDRPTMAGVEPKRSFESEVILNPVSEAGNAAAIFAEGNMNMTNQVNVKDGGDVWVDQGNLLIQQGGFRVDGNVYAPGGGITFSGGGTVEGSVYALNEVRSEGTSTFNGDIIVKDGGLRLASSGNRVNGKVELGGTYQGQGTIVGQLRENVDVGAFPASKGMPRVDYVPQDWYNAANWDEPGQVFQPWPGKSESQAWEDAIYENALENRKNKNLGDAPNHGDCPLFGSYHGRLGEVIRLPFETSGATHPPRVFNVNLDKPGCKFSPQDTTFKIYGDVVLFASEFEMNYSLRFESGDGKEHRVWLIAPYEKTNARFSSSTPIPVDPKLKMFVYLNGKFDVSNGLDITGHLYAKEYSPNVPINITPGDFGIPGVDLLPGYVNPEAAWNVDVVYKRETGDRVN